MIRILLSLFLVLGFGTGVSAAAEPGTSRLALVGGALVDGFGGSPVLDSVVLIEGERIVAVGREDTLPVPPDYKVIPTYGMTVLPGLWDMHVHLMIDGHGDYDHWFKTYDAKRLEREVMPASARELLMAGVTSARDLGSMLQPILNVRSRIQSGEILGPTLYVAGPLLQHKPYPGSEAYRWGINGVADARQKVRKLVKAGVDLIKVVDQDQMTPEELAAIVEEAHRAGKRVTVHGHRPNEIRRGLAAGVDSFEHTGLAAASRYPDDIIAAIRERTGQETDPLFWCPTVTGVLNYTYMRDYPLALSDPHWTAYLPPDIAQDIRQSIRHFGQLPYNQVLEMRAPTIAEKIAQLRSAGVILLVGTDSGIPGIFQGDGTWREIDAWVRDLHIPAMDAIRAATYWPAVYMRVLDHVGTISPGKDADIIAVRGDVLRYVDLLQNVDIVIRHGERVK